MELRIPLLIPLIWSGSFGIKSCVGKGGMFKPTGFNLCFLKGLT